MRIPSYYITWALLLLLSGCGLDKNSPVAKPVTIAGQAGIEIGNNIVQARFLQLGMRLVSFRLLPEGENVFLFNENEFNGYTGAEWKSAGETEMLFPGEAWVRNGVWDVPCEWKVIRRHRDLVTVRFAATNRGIRFVKEVTLRRDSSILEMRQTVENISGRKSILGITSHPELGVGGGFDAADILFYYRDNSLKKVALVPGEPNRVLELGSPQTSIWGVHDALKKETLLRVFEREKVKSLTVFAGPDNYNLEENARPEEVVPQERSACTRSLILASGLPTVDAASGVLLLSCRPEADVIAPGTPAKLRFAVASGNRLSKGTVSAEIGVNGTKTRVDFPELPAGRAVETEILLPPGALEPGDNMAVIDVLSSGQETPRTSLSLKVDGEFLAKVRDALAASTPLNPKPERQALGSLDRAAIRNSMKELERTWSLRKASAAFNEGRVMEAARILGLDQSRPEAFEKF